MKKAVLYLAFIGGISAYSQTAVDTLSSTPFKDMDKGLKPPDIDFSYYGKNYNKVFGEFNFSYDANNFGSRNVYVGYGDVLYYQGNSAYIMQMPNNIHSYNFAGYQDVIGGIKNLSTLFSGEKDYSVKQP
jgi:hypothetical protein